MQLVQLALQQRINVGFIAQGQQVGFVTQQLVTKRPICEMGWYQLGTASVALTIVDND